MRHSWTAYQPEVFKRARELSAKGLVIIGGVANQHYLPPELHSEHRDLDIVAGQTVPLRQINRVLGELPEPIPPFTEIGHHKGPAYSAYGTITPGGLPIHLEHSAVPFKSIPTALVGMLL